MTINWEYSFNVAKLFDEQFGKNLDGYRQVDNTTTGYKAILEYPNG